MKPSLVTYAILFIYSSRSSLALLPQDNSFTENCIACVQSGGSTFNLNLNDCVSTDCYDIDRCCTTVECCVNDGCRAPSDYFAYDGVGEFTSRCDTCCDALQTPSFDEMELFLDSLISDKCSSVFQNSGEECQMTLSFTDTSNGYATFTVSDTQLLNTDTGVVQAAFNVTSDHYDRENTMSSNEWAAEPYVSYSSSFSIEACPTALLFYAKQRFELESVLGVNAKYSFVESEDNYCSYFAKSLIYKYAALWYNLSDISVNTLGTSKAANFDVIPKLFENEYPKICQYRFFVNATDEQEPYYNMVTQSVCVDTYQYPPSCPKCALCSKRDEEQLLSQELLSTDEVNSLLKKCPYMASTISRKRGL